MSVRLSFVLLKELYKARPSSLFSFKCSWKASDIDLLVADQEEECASI